jgi:hypothetical protein
MQLRWVVSPLEKHRTRFNICRLAPSIGTGVNVCLEFGSAQLHSNAVPIDTPRVAKRVKDGPIQGSGSNSPAGMDSNKQSCKVFVGGLSWTTDDAKLRSYFDNFGSVVEAVSPSVSSMHARAASITSVHGHFCSYALHTCPLVFISACLFTCAVCQLR